MVNEANIPRMRTLKEVIAQIKAADPQTAISESRIRKLCLQGKIVHIRSGKRILVNLDKLYEYLNTTEENKEENFEYGKIRKIRV